MIRNIARLARWRGGAGQNYRKAAQAAQKARDWTTAASLYDDYLSVNPLDWRIWVQHGHCRKEAGDFDGAVSSYLRAAGLDPTAADPAFHLGHALLASGKMDSALQHFQRSADLGEALAVEALAAIEEKSSRDAEERRAFYNKMSLKSYYVAKVAGRSRQVWVGSGYVDGLECIDLAARPNFRAEGSWHNRFDVVWLFEQPLSNLAPSQWPLLLDEAIRLLDEDGHLIVRYEQNDEISVMKVRNFLARRPGLTITMDPPDLEEGRIMHDIFHIHRDNIAAYRDNAWSFIILSQGARTPTVIAFLDRLKLYGDKVPYEVIIVGPNLPEYAPYDVLVYDKSYRTDYAQIALKKNDAAKFASNANLCIMHDRFLIEPNFFSGFDEFGYDFDFVAVHQKYSTGQPYPFYAELSKAPMVWSVPIHTASFQDIRPTHFVNGGFMVFKRHTFAQIGFNPLLGWNEAEDVEVSHTYLSRGLPARVNLASIAVTTVPTSHTAMFLADTSAPRR